MPEDKSVEGQIASWHHAITEDAKPDMGMKPTTVPGTLDDSMGQKMLGGSK